MHSIDQKSIFYITCDISLTVSIRMLLQILFPEQLPGDTGFRKLRSTLHKMLAQLMKPLHQPYWLTALRFHLPD